MRLDFLYPLSDPLGLMYSCTGFALAGREQDSPAQLSPAHFSPAQPNRERVIPSLVHH